MGSNNINKQNVLKKLEGLSKTQKNSDVKFGVDLAYKVVKDEPAVTQTLTREEAIKAAKLVKRYCNRRTNCDLCPINCRMGMYASIPNGWEIAKE